MIDSIRATVAEIEAQLMRLHDLFDDVETRHVHHRPVCAIALALDDIQKRMERLIGDLDQALLQTKPPPLFPDDQIQAGLDRAAELVEEALDGEDKPKRRGRRKAS